MTEEEIAVTLTKCKEEISLLRHRMESVENITKSINELAMSVRELTLNVGHMLEHQEEHENRISNLEKIPSEKYNKIVGELMKAIIGVAIGAIGTALFTMM